MNRAVDAPEPGSFTVVVHPGARCGRHGLCMDGDQNCRRFSWLESRVHISTYLHTAWSFSKSDSFRSRQSWP